MTTAHKHVSHHEAVSRSISHLITLLAAIALASLFAYLQTKDAADDDKARAHVEQKSRTAAQPDTWDKLDAQSKQMVAFDRIKK